MRLFRRTLPLVAGLAIAATSVAYSASTTTTLPAGDSLKVTCAGTKLTWARSTSKAGTLACLGTPTTTTTTVPPTTTTTTEPPTTTTTTAPPDGGGDLGTLARIPWEGGPAYYARWSKAVAAGWTSPARFPISVFLGKPGHAAALKAVGINTYMGAETDGSPVSDITGQGLSLIAQEGWTQAQVGDNPLVVGWSAGDECDMGFCGGANEQEGLAIMTDVVNALRARNDGRFVFTNFGNGVLRSFWMPTLMADMVRLVDVASVDKYTYTSPHVQDLLANATRWPAGANPKSSAAYGWLADQLRSFWSDLRPTWVFVETATPYLGGEPGSETIPVEHLEGAVWSAIIHEARGIAYFQHNDGPLCGTYSLVDCDPGRLARIAAVNAKVQSLAPVLNTQSYAYVFENATDTMLKTYAGSAYVFAGIGLNEAPGVKSFTLPAGVRGTTVEVVGEGRTLPVTNGRFTDTFAAEYSHHVYKVAL